MGEIEEPIEGLRVTALKVITHPKGDIFHVVKQSEGVVETLGEVYFSSIHYREIKAWKRHSRMTLNLVVPTGAVRFVFHDDRESSTTRGKNFSIVIGPANYRRLTVPPGVWMGFQGRAEGISLILNVADIEHDPTEQVNVPTGESDISFDWGNE